MYPADMYRSEFHDAVLRILGSAPKTCIEHEITVPET